MIIVDADGINHLIVSALLVAIRLESIKSEVDNKFKCCLIEPAFLIFWNRD